MTSSIAKKQNYLYFGMLTLTVIITIFCYRFFEKKWLLFREGENKFNENKFKESIDYYEKSLAMGSVSTTALLHLADAYVAEGRFAEAIKWYQIYLTLKPDDLDARHSYAKALSWNGNIKEAAQQYQLLLQKHESEYP